MKNGENKISWIAWKKVLNSVENGGLGIGSLKALNVALLGKWWWRFYKEENSIWRKVIVSIHGSNGNLGGIKKTGCWSSICSLNDSLGLGSTDLRHLFFEGDRGMEWGLEDDGIFSVSSLRSLLDDNWLIADNKTAFFFKHGPKKASILLWRACNGRLPTRSNLGSRGVYINSALCPLCNCCVETENHLFLECRVTGEVRRSLHLWFKDFNYVDTDITKVASSINGVKGRMRPLVEIIHLAFLYYIWYYRNDLVHLAKTKCAKELECSIKLLSFNWYRSRVRLASCLNWDAWFVDPIIASNSLTSH